MLKRALVITGLPASGKTGIGRQLAQSLGLALVDKDDFLERLFEEKGVGDLSWRRQLSRESDLAFQEAAVAPDSAVLVSHWRPLNGQGQSGTPTEWLAEAFQEIVEIYCDCPLSEAIARFAKRTRHEGHCDKLQTDEELSASMRDYGKCVPLGLGPLIRVDTTEPFDVDQVALEACHLLGVEPPAART